MSDFNCIDNNDKKLVSGMTFAAITLGCKVNQYETQAISELMEKEGFKEIPFDGDQPADIYIINTCSVTGAADGKNRNAIRQAHKKNPEGIIAVTGCYSQVAGEKITELPGVCVVTGTSQRKQIPELIKEYIKTGEKKISVKAQSHKEMDFEDLHVNTVKDHTRAFVKIQDGCNSFCTYCIIPYARGAERSRDLDDVLEEAKRLEASGYREIVLTGINLTSYGRDMKNASTGLSEAVEAISKIKGIERIRLSSLEPMYFTEDIIRRLSENEKFCRHFHLALQSGSDSVLRKMNRKYTTQEFSEIRDMIVGYMPDAGITTDIMVGFPGETDEDHMLSMDFARRMHFSRMHVFPYSARPGTSAAKMPCQVPPSVKKQRAEEMGRVAFDLKKDFMTGQIGTCHKILLETDRSDGNYIGFTGNYCESIVLGSSGYAPGDIVKTVIKDVSGNYCLAEII